MPQSQFVTVKTFYFTNDFIIDVDNDNDNDNDSVLVPSHTKKADCALQ